MPRRRSTSPCTCFPCSTPSTLSASPPTKTFRKLSAPRPSSSSAPGRTSRNKNFELDDSLRLIRIRLGASRELRMQQMKPRRFLIGARERQQLRLAVQFSEKRQAGGGSGAAVVLEIARVVSWRLPRIVSAQAVR